jgi:DNA-directed RNA polymerase I, II, and III subunit RPABC2
VKGDPAANSEGVEGNKTARRISIGPPKLTRFEKARVVGARALQIAMGAPILISPTSGVGNPIDLALAELDANVLPITVRRMLPNGDYQDVPILWLSQKEG